MTTRTATIVGSYYRQADGVPAPAILARLQQGAALILRADPNGRTCNADHNDPTSISVWIARDSLREAIGDDNTDFEEQCLNCGSTYDDLLDEPMLHLGYLPKVLAARTTLSYDEGNCYPATFAFDLTGKPAASWIEP